MKKLLLFFVFFSMAVASSGQGRTYIKDQIRLQGECRNVAITKTNGDLMLYGRNGCARSGCPAGLNRAISELNTANEFIDDIQLTENGRWLILYGDNGLQWSDIPYSLEHQIRKDNADGEVITSITFNDYGDWIVITTNHYTSSDAEITQWLKEGANSYGMLWAACITDDAMAAVYEDGYRFYGEVPSAMKTALQKTNLDVYRLKIAGSAWFFADIDGNYEAYL